MADLPESNTWEAGIYQIELTDPVQGGLTGVSNTQAKQLANRTAYLKDRVDTLEAADLDTRVTELETNTVPDLQAQIYANKGSIAAVKHGVIACRNNVQDWNFMNGTSFSIGSTTANVFSSPTDPFIASISCGFDSNGPVIKYVYLTSTVTNTNDFFSPTGKITVLLPNGTILCRNFVSYTVAWTAPSSPSNGALWYSLHAQCMFLYDGSLWVQYDCLVLAFTTKDSVASPTLTYYPTIGRGINDLYGSTLIPAGTVNAFAGAVASIPEGYLLCNGGAVSRTVYADLFRAIGTRYGVGNGTTTFNLPDLRGEFIRGLDNGRGIDSGRALGSAQAESVNTAGVNLREASTTWAATGAAVGSSVAYFENSNIAGYGTNMALLGGTETRPRNIAMNFIIKF